MNPNTSSSAPAGTEVCVVNPLGISDWDRQVAGLPGANFFHSQGWARVLHASYGYEPLYLTRSTAGKINALLPLMEVRSWLTGRRGVSLPFSDEVAPLCGDAGTFRSLHTRGLELARERRWKYFEGRGGKRWLPDAAASVGFWNHHLALEPDTAALFSRMDDSVRRAVRKAEKQNLTVEFSATMEAMEEFFALLSLTRRRHGLPPQPFRFFANIRRHILTAGHGWIVLVRQQGRPVAGAVFVHFGRIAYYKFGASDDRYLPLRANNLAIWSAIRRCAAEGFSQVDFGRTSLQNDGLRRFKLGWGTSEELIEYFRFDCSTNSYVTVSDESAGWYNRLFQILPLPISRAIGSAFYGHKG